MNEALIKMAVSGIFTEVFDKCILRYAGIHKTGYNHVFVMLSLDPTLEKVKYHLLLNLPGELTYEPLVAIPTGYAPRVKEEISILDILNVEKFHIEGYDQLAPPYIQAALIKLAEDNNMNPAHTAIMVCTSVDYEVYLFLCHFEDGKIVNMVKMLEEGISELF